MSFKLTGYKCCSRSTTTKTTVMTLSDACGWKRAIFSSYESFECSCWNVLKKLKLNKNRKFLTKMFASGNCSKSNGKWHIVVILKMHSKSQRAMSNTDFCCLRPRGWGWGRVRHSGSPEVIQAPISTKLQNYSNSLQHNCQLSVKN